MNGELDKVFRRLLSDVNREAMKPKGWKRSGQNFRLIQQKGIFTIGRIVNFQKSQWNSREELRFTVNVGRKMVIGGEIAPNFKEYDCHYLDRKRPQGLCKKYTSDQWWSITAETDYDALKAEIEGFLEEYAIPWSAWDAG